MKNSLPFRHPNRQQFKLGVKDTGGGSTGAQTKTKDEKSARQIGPAKFSKRAIWFAGDTVGFEDGTTISILV